VTATSVPLREHGHAFSRAGERIGYALDGHFWRYAAGFLLLFLVCSIAEDLRLKMWNDELVTLYVAQQGSPREIIQATQEGMDATPPLYPIMVSAILPTVRPEALAVRLPATLGFTAMLLCILAFCRRRMPAVYAFIAASVAATICAFYATEGRCYGLVLGCAGGALLTWQSAIEDKRRVLWLSLLALCLTLATALHYYSIFLLIPLSLAEFVRWRRRRQPDFAVFAAMLPALAVLALHYPLIAVGRRYLSHFWAPGIATWRQLPDFYLQFALIPAAVVLVGLIARAIPRDQPRDRSAGTPVLPAQEWVAIGALALMPIVVIALSRYTTHVFLARYTLWAVIGLAVVSASLLCVTAGRQPLIGATVLAVMLGTVVTQQVLRLHQPPVLRQGEAIRRALQSVPDGPEPILIAYNHAFMELSSYAEPRVRQRLYYAQSRSLELRYRGSDLDYLLLSARRQRTKLHIVELDNFLEANPKFVLAARAEDYLPQYLAAAGYRLLPLSPRTALGLYEVEAPQS